MLGEDDDLANLAGTGVSEKLLVEDSAQLDPFLVVVL